VYAAGHIVTPEVGTILEGITRSSIIELAGKLGHQVEERRFSVDEWRDGISSGDIVEVFACGTAAVVTPVGQLRWDGGEAGAADGDAGELTMQIRQALVDIQYGRADDTFGWMHRVC
jgi:branched-chain amino acid aminotransferase